MRGGGGEEGGGSAGRGLGPGLRLAFSHPISAVRRPGRAEPSTSLSSVRCGASLSAPLPRGLSVQVSCGNVGRGEWGGGSFGVQEGAGRGGAGIERQQHDSCSRAQQGRPRQSTAAAPGARHRAPPPTWLHSRVTSVGGSVRPGEAARANFFRSRI